MSLPAPPAIEWPAAFAFQGFSLRLASGADLAFERRLFETARSDAVLLAAWPEAARAPFFDQQFHFQTLHYSHVYPHAERLIVLAKGEPIGRLTVDRAGDPWCVVDIALMPERRGTGLGTRLLQSVQSAAQARSCRVQLTVDMQSPARRLYERLGFAAVEESFPTVVMAWPAPGTQLKTA